MNKFGWNAVSVAIVILILTIALKYLPDFLSVLSEPPPIGSSNGEIKQNNQESSHTASRSPQKTTEGQRPKSNHETNRKHDKTDLNSDSPSSASTVQLTELAAQRGMWRATNAMVQLTLLQMIAGILSLIAIAWTLWETRRSVYASIRSAAAAENAESAHVLVEFKVEFSGPVFPNSPIVSEKYAELETFRCNSENNQLR